MIIQMSISEAEVRHVAKLARIAITDAEAVQYSKELSSILGWIDKLQECDTTGIEPIANITGLTNVTRPDVVDAFTAPEKLVASTPHKVVDSMLAIPNKIMEIVTKTLAELSTALQAGTLTSSAITEAYISQIEATDGEINAYVHTCFDTARKMAAASDQRRKDGKLLSKLDGIPMSMKDVISTIETPTTAASGILQGYTSPFDATLWARLKAAGVVLLGKVNTDEFTMGSSTETSFYGITKNPHDTTRVPGGSSGGSAAAVAGHMCAASIGTDTGGSIRQPAHFCGITGLKPTYGRVSRWGTIPMASSLDCPGPMAKTAEDCAMVLQVIAGHDEKDSNTLQTPGPDYLVEIKKPLTGMKIGVPKEYTVEGMDPAVEAGLNKAKVILTQLGAELVEVSLPHTEYAPACYYVLAPSEISANMARFDGLRYGTAEDGKDLQEMYTQSRAKGIGAEVKRRIMIGTYALSAGFYDAYYNKAQAVRTLIKKDFDNAFKTVDALLSPTSPTPAFKIGSKTGDPVQMYLEDVFTIPSNLAGICGISLPITATAEGLPVGVQILANQNQETIALRVAHQMQENMT